MLHFYIRDTDFYLYLYKNEIQILTILLSIRTPVEAAHGMNVPCCHYRVCLVMA